LSCAAEYLVLVDDVFCILSHENFSCGAKIEIFRLAQEVLAVNATPDQAAVSVDVDLGDTHLAGLCNLRFVYALCAFELAASSIDALNFILRYAVSPKLRVEVDRRRFMQRVQALPPNFFIDIERLSPKEKQRVFAEFFGAGSLFEYLDPPTKRRILAKRFHPDAGGDPQAMRVINEVFDCLRAAPVTGA